MKNIFSLTLSLSFVAITTSGLAQDIVYSQPYANPGATNPALTGLNNTIRATLQYRQQWSSLDDGYTTYGFAGLYPLALNEGKDKLDFGMYAANSKEGAFSRTGISISAGYNIRLSEAGYINVSLQAGYQQNAIKLDGLTFDDQYVLGSYSSSNATAEVLGSGKTSYVDVGAGLMWYYIPDADARLNAFVGIGAFHLNQPNDAFAGSSMRLSRRYSGQAGVKIIGDNKIDFIPNAYYFYQGGAQVFAPGLTMEYRASDDALFGIGGWLKSKNSITLMASVAYSFFQLSYSYDVYHSQINNYITGLPVHEVSLSVRFGKPLRSGRPTSSMF